MRRSLLKKQTLPTFSFSRRPLKFLFLGLVALSGLVLLVIMFPPTVSLTVGPLQLSITLLFFALVGSTVFGLTTFVTNRKKHGLLLSLFIMSYLWLRLNSLFHPLFLILLIALFLTLELLFTAKEEQ